MAKATSRSFDFTRAFPYSVCSYGTVTKEGGDMPRADFILPQCFFSNGGRKLSLEKAGMKEDGGRSVEAYKAPWSPTPQSEREVYQYLDQAFRTGADLSLYKITMLGSPKSAVEVEARGTPST